MRGLRSFLAIERSALARFSTHTAAVALALLGAEVGALGLATALVRFRVAVAGHSSDALLAALGAVGLGLDLAIVLGSLSFGAAIVALTRPRSQKAWVLPSAHASAGTVSILATYFVVVYALTLGLSRLTAAILAHPASRMGHAALLACALVPPLLVAGLLGAAVLSGITLVGRGVPPGRALASGIDHVLRNPGRALSLLVAHALIACALLQIGAWVGRGARLIVLAPMCSLAALLAVCAFDAAIARDPRIATG